MNDTDSSGDVPMPQASIRSYHAHVYYESATRAVAEWLREQLGQRFTVQLGRWHDKLVGPHTGSMYQVAFATDQFAELGSPDEGVATVMSAERIVRISLDGLRSTVAVLLLSLGRRPRRASLRTTDRRTRTDFARP